MAELTEKQARFVEEYLVDFNASRAARDAGYSKKGAPRYAVDLLKKPHIQKAIAAAVEARSERVRIDADYVLTTIRDTVERCRQAEAVVDDEGQETGEYRFDSRGVLKGCELLGKHLRLFVERVEVDAGEELIAAIMAGRERAKRRR